MSPAPDRPRRRDQTPYAIDRYDGVWNPTRQSSALTAPFRCDLTTDAAGDGDCMQFFYTDMGGVLSFDLDDDGGFGHQAFAAGKDNTGALGVDFFERGLRTNDRALAGYLSYR
jgi:hypothetical protein